MAASLFGRSVAIAVAAYFIAAHIPFFTGGLEFIALGWAAYWFGRQAGRSGTWLHGAAIGGLGGLLGLMVTRLIASVLFAAAGGLAAFAALAGPGRALASVGLAGALFGVVGWWLASRGGRTPWRRWDPED